MSAIKKLMTKSFLERLISGIILVLIALITIILGGNVLLATIGIISVIGYFELVRVYKLEKSPMAVVGYIACVSYYVILFFKLNESILFLIIVALLLNMAFYVFTFPKYKAYQLMITVFGLFYVVIMLSYIYQVRMMDTGKYLVWLIFLSSWGCDTCAYLVGVMFGNKRLAPVLSPKKSLEGAIGGVIGAALLAFIYSYIFREQMGDNAIIIYPIVCFFGAIASQVGDLTASGIKRENDVKDYSHLIPGHGGILDRFDSMIVTAPIIFYLSTYLGKL
ncbi:phosphatidate cytidylyltransferase [Lachnospiraceae bacterium RM5]|nr:phosphatidate cytidylyltransferase [Lachnospiraceae bacterium RM5]